MPFSTFLAPVTYASVCLVSDLTCYTNTAARLPVVTRSSKGKGHI